MNKSLPLFDQTLELVNRSELPVAQLCRDLEVTERWYYKLISGEIKDPSVNRIQRLHDYLVNKEAGAA